MKYPELTGKCKTCQGGCGRLEDYNFIGTDNCEYAPEETCRRILKGEQQKI